MITAEELAARMSGETKSKAIQLKKDEEWTHIPEITPPELEEKTVSLPSGVKRMEEVTFNVTFVPSHDTVEVTDHGDSERRFSPGLPRRNSFNIPAGDSSNWSLKVGEFDCKGLVKSCRVYQSDHGSIFCEVSFLHSKYVHAIPVNHPLFLWFFDHNRQVVIQGDAVVIQKNVIFSNPDNDTGTIEMTFLLKAEAKTMTMEEYHRRQAAGDIP